MSDYPTGLLGAATHIWTITPSNDQELDPMPKAIRAVGAGTITLRARDSGVDVAHPVLDGERIDGIMRFIRADGTNVQVIGYA